jgi:nicotinate-nucleotide adenylyltransferase
MPPAPPSNAGPGLTNRAPWSPAPPGWWFDGSVGLLGGSFNPAHAGHRHIAEEALYRLGVDEVWWMVSPQNPLKETTDMAPFEERFASAERLAAHPRMRITGIEGALGTTYTAQTLARLTEIYTRIRFIWIMGADNLIQIPKWKDWTQIFHRVPVAVFARPTYSLRAFAGPAAARFGASRIRERDARLLPYLEPPAWVFLHTKLHPESATAIRRARSGPS